MRVSDQTLCLVEKRLNLRNFLVSEGGFRRDLLKLLLKRVDLGEEVIYYFIFFLQRASELGHDDRKVT